MLREANVVSSVKVCSDCGEAKPLGEFRGRVNQESTPDGLNGWCRACGRKRWAEAERRNKATLERRRRVERRMAGEDI